MNNKGEKKSCNRQKNGAQQINGSFAMKIYASHDV